MNYHLNKATIENSPNIGLFCFCNDHFCLVGNNIKPQEEKVLADALQVPVYKLSVLHTDLLGVFITGNNTFLLAPKLSERESKELQSICTKHHVKLFELELDLNTLGNNILLLPDVLYVHQDIDEHDQQLLATACNLPIKKFIHEHFETPGSIAYAYHSLLFHSQDIHSACFETEATHIPLSINRGTATIKSGLVCNKHGALVGNLSTPIEIQTVLDALNDFKTKNTYDKNK